MTKELREKLSAPFPAEDVEWRIQQANCTKDRKWGLALAYITARGVMNRLDDVFGIEGWQDDYEVKTENVTYYEHDGTQKMSTQISVICTLRVKIGNTWVTKVDGAPTTHVEPLKGGLSDALKRTAVKLGIGRYLYNLDATFVTMLTDRPSGEHKTHWDNKTKAKYFWEIPTLPGWALPDVSSPTLASAPHQTATESAWKCTYDITDMSLEQKLDMDDLLKRFSDAGHKFDVQAQGKSDILYTSKPIKALEQRQVFFS